MPRSMYKADELRLRRASAPEAAVSNNVDAGGATCDPQLLKSLSRMTVDQAKSPGAGKEEANSLAEEGSLQREMLKDPRFGSPLMCDALVMLLALVLLFCGFTAYFSANRQAGVSPGYNYGLALCGMFIFLLGLRSASLHLIHRTDTTEDRVLYILDKFGGSVWIPKVPEVLHVGNGDSPAPMKSVRAPASPEEPCRLVLDPATSSVFLLSDVRPPPPAGLPALPLTSTAAANA